MKKALLIAAAFALAGCNSTKVFHSAIEDITQDTRATVGDFSTYRQLITLNGLMPMHVPGMLFYEPTSRILPDWLAYWLPKGDSPGLLVGISPKRSMVVEARYDATEPEEAVASAQKAYQALRNKAVVAVAARLKVAMFDALSEPKSEEQARKLARHLNLPETPSAEAIAEGRALAALEADKARKDLDEAQAAFSTGLRDNVMVARWTKKEDFQGFARIADLVGLGTGRHFEESGVLILAGIRVLNTSFGEDLFCMARHAKGNAGQWEHLKRVSIAVNMVQARAVGYVSDLDVAHTLALSLDISKEQLGQLLKERLLDPGAGARVKAEALVASAMGVSNFGRMVKPAVDQRKTRFYPAARQIEELEEELEDRGRYVTVSVTRVQFTESMLDGLAKAASDTICNEELEPGRSLTETVARTTRRIEVSAAAASNLIGYGGEELPRAADLRHSLNRKLVAARTTLQACQARISDIDRNVTDALAAEIAAPGAQRDALRYRVRISHIERERDGARILAYLNGVSNELHEAHKGLRAASQLKRERLDPLPEVLRVADLLRKGEAVEPLRVAGTDPVQAKEVLSAEGRAVVDATLAEYCRQAPPR